MKIPIKSDTYIAFLGLFLLGLIFSLCLKFTPKTYAENEDSEQFYSVSSDEKFVTIFDTTSNEEKTIKTNALTVGEVLNRVEILLDSTDSVSPSIESPIDADHFFINIYRSRPVLVVDGIAQKIINTSSFDPRIIARSAGFTLYDDDLVKLSPSTSFLESGISSAYEIIRGTGKTITLEEDIDFSTETISDYTIPVGSEEIRQLGELGKIRRIYTVKSIDGTEAERELISEEILREPVARIIAIGTAAVNASPLTPSMGRNRYTAKNLSGSYVERQETFYDLPMRGVMSFCGKSSYSVRYDGVKVDDDGYVIVAANLSRYPRCSIVETSLGSGKVYDTGTFATSNPEQFDLATDWTNRDGI